MEGRRQSLFCDSVCNSLFRVFVETALFYTIPVLSQPHRPCSLYTLSASTIASFPQCLQPTTAKRKTKQPTGAQAAPQHQLGGTLGNAVPWVVLKTQNLFIIQWFGLPWGSSAVQEDFVHMEKVHMADWVHAYGCVSLWWLGSVAMEISGRALSKIFFSLHGTDMSQMWYLNTRGGFH